MARGINKVILVGNLGADPEVRYMPSGSAVTAIRLATSEAWKDKQTGEQHEQTEWHRIVFFNRLAEIAAEYLRKGSKLYVEGSLRTRKWQDKDGQDRYTTEIVAKEMQMLDSKGAASNLDMSETSAPSSNVKTGGNGHHEHQQHQHSASESGATSRVADEAIDFNDDIPF